MKIESGSMLHYESRNCKYALLRKQKLQVCLSIKTGTGTILNYEDRNCKYA